MSFKLKYLYFCESSGHDQVVYNLHLSMNFSPGIFYRLKKSIVFVLLIGIFASLPGDCFIQPSKNARLNWDNYLLSTCKKIPVNADGPDLAALQNYFMTIDPELKRVPTERLYNAYIKTKELRSAVDYKTTMGPGWTETGSDMGGRTRAIVWDPNDPDGTKVWAGSVTGGLWFNNDIYNDSSDWQQVNDFWPALSISTIVSDPNDPLTIYVGTGECETARLIYRESSGVGYGIWKSTDGGTNWEIIPSTASYKYISDLKIRDEDGLSVVYAGVVSGYYQGVNHNSSPSEGLYRSTNGGLSWQQVLPYIQGTELAYAPADIEIGPTGRMFIGTMKNLSGDGGATILFSDPGTLGTWMIFDDYEEIIQNSFTYNVPGRVILACAPSDPNRIYALIGAGWLNSTNFNYAVGKYILRSNDGGLSWQERNLPGWDPEWANISWHAFTASVNPGNPNEIYVGGKDVWKSTNSGSNWSKVSDWTLMYSGGGEDYVHCDQHQQLYKEGSNIEMLLISDGGVFHTGNATSGNPVFEEKNNNYSTLQFYTCDIYPEAGSNYFIGGLQDNGTLLYSGEPLKVSDMIDVGDGAYCFFDENQPQIMITSTYFNVYTMFYSWDYFGTTGMDGTGIFINPADYDSENNILFANAVKFNGTYPNQLLRITGIPYNPYEQLITLSTGLNTWFTHIKVTPFGPDGSTTILLGSQNGRLFKIDNADSNPVVNEIGSNDFPSAYVSSVDYGASADTLLVTFSNYGVASVWQTYDGGNNWQNISGNLPDMPIRWGIYHPQSTKQIMLATEIGIWETADASTGEVIWEPDPVVPNVRVDMLQVRKPDNTVLAATHGRGLFYCFWNLNIASSIKEKDQIQIEFFPNPAEDFITISFNKDQYMDVVIISQSGKTLIEKRIISEEKIDLKGLSQGVYLVALTSGDKSVVRKIIIK
ncbi:MAG: T9SS type A sorting domain-containing protein [Bacteroidales bacterium]|nr:T9SS type A sorting domain-containing protein [Bacteroidales bacterium]MCF8404668.1 T9SS type A sorting domain-containing protein [Bacteroidales bacterium]